MQPRYRPAEARRRQAFVSGVRGLSQAADESTAQVIAGFTELVDAGRRDQEPALGLAFLDRALAQLSLGNLSTAAGASRRATAIFDQLLAQGRGDMRGWRPHRPLVRAEANLTADPAGAAADRP